MEDQHPTPAAEPQDRTDPVGESAAFWQKEFDAAEPRPMDPADAHLAVTLMGQSSAPARTPRRAS
ncbi:hypothetical protein HF998_04125 [Cellulomonas hominis]|uniref:hypothetical protein n=1 Tax=Cellulomonas hominis TaxID=156981 RepID=UPI0011BD8ED7|nr:hypothetical protein [Cellulomonas hominis]NKY06169.1 hypothetical protein [Cellulomonas hominis]